MRQLIVNGKQLVFVQYTIKVILFISSPHQKHICNIISGLSMQWDSYELLVVEEISQTESRRLSRLGKNYQVHVWILLAQSLEVTIVSNTKPTICLLFIFKY